MEENKKLTFQDLQAKTTLDLRKLEEKSRAELFALRFQAALGNLEKTHRVKQLSALIARVLTVLNLRKLQGADMKTQISTVEIQKARREVMEAVNTEAQAVAEKKQAALAEQQAAENPLLVDDDALNQALAAQELEAETESEPALAEIVNPKSSAHKNKKTSEAKATVLAKNPTHPNPKINTTHKEAK